MPKHSLLATFDTTLQQGITSVAPGSKPRTIFPLITISGASGKTSTGWLLVRLFEHAGIDVAAWLSDGVYVDGEIRQDELHAWELATNATRAREIDALVQEVPSVLASNLPANSTFIAVLTSICGSDEQCQRDVTMKRDQQAVEIVSAAVREDGHIVANADDLQIAEAAISSGKTVTYYAMNGANPILRNHIAAGGNAVWTQNGWVKIQFAGKRRRIVKLNELPVTLAGHLIFQVQNALAAIAAFMILTGDADALAAAVSKSARDRSKARHKGVSIRYEGTRTIVSDNPRSLAAIRQLVRGVRAFGAKRVIHLLGKFDALSRDEARDAARILGSLGGIAILAEDESSDQIDAIKAGLMNSDNPPVILVRQPDELTDAYINNLLNDGDVAIVLGQGI
jgi:cyanophycin synthetase